MRKGQRRYTRQELDDLAKLAKDLYENKHFSIRDISKKTGFSYGTVHRMMTVSGVKIRKRGNSSGG